MSSIDNKIVEMTFNNAAFERKIADTMKSLDNLKGKLDFQGSQRSLQDLGKASNNFSMAGMSSAIEGISGKFLAMSAVGFTVIANLTNRAVDAGVRIAKGFSLDPVLQGFAEYETNMNSIQTVLANTESKGTNLEDVNAALDELNTYADQTIYNFSEMTRNIGTFTAAGVDLDTSTSAIKGIANLAAISGSNSQQASTAMYQLSQALASGSVKLMDWNSIVNAGMGGEVFQKALFETGKALGTIADTPMDQTFDQWKEAGNTFRGSLEDGWITAEVLTNTLEGFTGDLTKAQVLSMGYTEEQADAILKMGETGKDAATKVKTLTQLIDTVKEAVGSGWSSSFRTIIGDFEEAKELFTNVSNVIGDIVSNSADDRNRLLTGWKNLGGRQALIDGLANSFKALQTFLKPISEAFRDIFPAMRAQRLAELTKNFEKFTETLILSGFKLDYIKAIFRGLFAALEIGWTIIKETAGFFKELFGVLTEGLPNNGILKFLAEFGDDLTELNSKLVAGGGIADFFDRLTESIKEFINDPMAALEEIGEKFKDAFNVFFNPDAFSTKRSILKDPLMQFLNKIRINLKELIGVPEVVSNGIQRLKDRFEGFSNLAEKFSDMPDGLSDALNKVRDILSTVGEEIGQWLSELGQKLSDQMGPSDFDPVLDALNVSLLGGIALLLKKLVSGGLNIDFGGGMLQGITDSLGALTGKLEAMQADIKANALLKIAGAVALLTASVVILSLIDSKALTKALTAMTVGFGQLIGAMSLMNQITMGPKGAATMVALATAMVILSGAVLLLAFAVKTMSSLSWEELLKGLLGVTILLGTIVAVVKLLEGSTGGLIRAGLGIIAIAIAMNILAAAMKIFATMSWEDMSKGLVGVAGGLAAIVAAVNLLPKGMAAKGAGILLVAIALNFLATAMKIFATMDWEEIGKGLAGVAGGLVVIALAMKLMPGGKKMLANAAALLIVSVSLNILAQAVKSMGKMSWDEIGKGLATMAASLLILAGAMALMNGSLAGAAALAIVASSLWLLIEVIKGFASLSIRELVTALIGFAGVLLTLGLTALVLQPLVPALLGLGAAMLLLGAGFALFGIGAQAVAKAFVLIADAGKAGVEVLMFAFDQIIMRLPTLLGAFAIALAELALVFLEAAPPIIEAVGILLVHILDTVIEVAPKLAEAFVALVTAGLTALRELFPEVVATGYALLIALLQGLRDNIVDITTLVSEIIVEFLGALAGKMPDIVTAGITTLVEFLNGVAENIGDVVDAGIDILVQLIDGIVENIDDIGTAATDLIVAFIEEVSAMAGRLIIAGKSAIIDFIEGIGNALGDIITAGADTIVGFLQGVSDNVQYVVDAGFDIIIDFINGITASIRENSSELRTAGLDMAAAIVSGITFGLSDKVGSVVSSAKDLAGKAKSGFMRAIGAESPSKDFMKIAGYMAEGLVIGMDNDTSAENSAESFATRVTKTFKESLSKIPEALANMDDFNPTITPVLDLTSVKNEAGKLGGLLNVSPLSASVSFDQATLLSVATTRDNEDTTFEPQEAVTKEINFNQTINSPTALSTADIYRQTRSQISLAKEELSIP